jgi:hypothetical protein
VGCAFRAFQFGDSARYPIPAVRGNFEVLFANLLAAHHDAESSLVREKGGRPRLSGNPQFTSGPRPASAKGSAANKGEKQNGNRNEKLLCREVPAK